MNDLEARVFETRREFEESQARFDALTAPRRDFEARLQRCFPHREVRVDDYGHGVWSVWFTQGKVRHAIDVLEVSLRPNDMLAAVLDTGKRILDVLFPGSRH